MLADTETPACRHAPTSSGAQRIVDAAVRAVAAADDLAERERTRTASALARLDELYEPIRQRRDHLDVGLSRIIGLRATMVARLDALSPDTDLEPNGDREPTLCHPGSYDTQDGELEEDADSEPLNANLHLGPVDQSGFAWCGGVSADELEEQCEDEGAEHDGREFEDHD